MDVELGLFHAFAGEHAFAVVVDFKHVEFGFFAFPAKNGLKNMGDVIHEVHRIVPADDKKPGVEVGAGFGLVILLDVGQDFRCFSSWHGAK
jgi:hypothetical protein